MIAPVWIVIKVVGQIFPRVPEFRWMLATVTLGTGRSGHAIRTGKAGLAVFSGVTTFALV